MKKQLGDKEYMVKKHTTVNKRVCLALDLKNDQESQAKYKWHHLPENVWKEINEGIKASGVKVMDIYNIDMRMYMICEVDAEADFDTIWNEMGTYPRQSEWAELMANFQQALPGHKLEWLKMERVFSLENA
ncbi:MAG: L-rhamnose mutarotase [Prolixibacteraceae bacterium]